MSSSTNTSYGAQAPLPQIDPQQRRLSRIKLVSIFAIFAVPLLMASVYLHMVRTSGGSMGDTSRGELIAPAVPLTEFALSAPQEEFNLDTLHGQWTMLYLSLIHI